MESLSSEAKAMMSQRLSTISLRPANGVKAKLNRQNRLSKLEVGSLSKIADLPMEVFLEIASTLEPADLLSLSRVSKNLRKIFMSRKSRFVWDRAFRSAIAVLRLPIGCPPDLNEPQYASLLFDRLCSACNSVRASKLYMTLRLRFCTACEKANLGFGYTMTAPEWRGINNCTIWMHLPCATYDYSAPLDFNARNNTQWSTYSLAEHERVMHEFSDLKNDAAALQKHSATRMAMTTVILQHGALVMGWYQVQEKLREHERKQAKKSSQPVERKVTRSISQASIRSQGRAVAT